MSDRPARRVVVGAVGVALCAVALTGLVVQATRGNGVVGVQLRSSTRHAAAVDNAFYRCLSVQAGSLVGPDEPVLLGEGVAQFADWVTLTKGVVSWIDVAPDRSSARFLLSLRDGVTGRPACLGTVVVARPAQPSEGRAVRVGTGASVPGQGPPPAPPL